jgi:serine/threonine-protein kinase
MQDTPRAALDRESRLYTVLADCVEALENGSRLDPRELLARYPEFTSELTEFFAGRNQLERMAAPLREAGQAANTDDANADDSLSQPSSHPDQCGQSFGDYELLAEIGRGGMGVVYKARQKSLNRLVALKMIRASALASPADLARFRTEAEAAASLDHPHIVSIHEVGQLEGQPYFTMKLIDGPSLAQWIADFRLKIAEFHKDAIRLMIEITEAVHHAHQRGILHRDLKPSNILLQKQTAIRDSKSETKPESEIRKRETSQNHQVSDCEFRFADFIPYVTDFGLAKRVERGESLTETGGIVGTPAYMSPEQALGKRGAITTATDVYGLGTILYALLTGRPPFAAETVLETLALVKEREPVFPGTAKRLVDRDLQTICLKCL